MVDGAGLLQLVGDQRVALVEEENAELLLVGEGLRGAPSFPTIAAAVTIAHGSTD